MLTEVKITKAIVNERQELVCSFICKAGDYTDTERLLLQNAKTNGDLLDLNFDGLVQGSKSEERNKNLQKLAFLMSRYCEERGTSEEEEKQRVYRRHHVKSRSELNDDQISFEIETYKAGLQYDI